METLRCQTRPPTHPGALLREIILPELRITQPELAKRLGVPRYLISDIIHEHRPITPDLAIRLGQFCGNGARLWLNLQQTFDLWQLEHSKYKEYQQIQKYIDMNHENSLLNLGY